MENKIYIVISSDWDYAALNYEDSDFYWKSLKELKKATADELDELWFNYTVLNNISPSKDTELLIGELVDNCVIDYDWAKNTNIYLINKE